MPFMGHAAPGLMPFDMAAGVVESSEFDGPLVDAAGKGHPVPQVIEMMGPMGEQTIYIEGVEFGVEIDDAIFRMR